MFCFFSLWGRYFTIACLSMVDSTSNCTDVTVLKAEGLSASRASIYGQEPKATYY
ncbi:hypothetical protein PR003_g29997 [Phytophthora rubi]|uniref:Pectate lyase n=1 Tax=Phytophthora rubi TaxID=129364 RepID=A0A6A4BF92_9STRA|nr:hypothetical protein PR001_g28848 [Phytophthora rubi]KAE9273119.1 hypothetical protein PR003_g29997 [Phytophthora rubi]